MDRCVYCKSKDVIKKGKQKNVSDEKQVYYCKDCNRRFVGSGIKYKTFNPRIILSAISFYNLGNSLEESSRLVNRKFKVKTSKSSVHAWLKEFKDIYPYHRIRNGILEEYGYDLIASKLFKHKGLTYNYKYHRAKLDKFGFAELKKYLTSFEKNFPSEIFEKGNRCSEIKINIKAARREKKNYACRLAELALKAASNNKERHRIVEEFMLINDTATVAVEVPVWFWEKKIGSVCGHVDILQVRFGEVYVLDFKPEAARENAEKVCSQLYLYTLGLSFRTGIPINKFRCAWFNDDCYYEFGARDVEVRFDG